MRVVVETPELTGPGLASLEAEWRELEGRASCSFFQSWSWIGCRVAARFDAPLLIRATVAGQTVGLALFNRHAQRLAPRTLWLHQTGNPAEDGVFIEHNGPLVADGHEAAARAILSAALRRGRVVMLSGVGDAVLGCVAGLGSVTVLGRRDAPYADLGRSNKDLWLSRRGASTRSQLGRSRRQFEASGTVSLRRATTLAEAFDFLDALATLHQAAWTRRGKPGAFAEPAFREFHQTLVENGLARGEVALWRLSVGSRAIGFLYNFCWRQQVLAYQSGFDTNAIPRTSPGLTMHGLAIAEAELNDMNRYDFLAGDSRYKRELGDSATSLHWVELVSRWSLRNCLNFISGSTSSLSRYRRFVRGDRTSGAIPVRNS